MQQAARQGRRGRQLWQSLAMICCDHLLSCPRELCGEVAPQPALRLGKGRRGSFLNELQPSLGRVLQQCSVRGETRESCDGEDTNSLSGGQYRLCLVKARKLLPPLTGKRCRGGFRSHPAVMSNECTGLCAVFRSAWKRENNGSLPFLPVCSNEGKSKLFH